MTACSLEIDWSQGTAQSQTFVPRPNFRGEEGNDLRQIWSGSRPRAISSVTDRTPHTGRSVNRQGAATATLASGGVDGPQPPPWYVEGRSTVHRSRLTRPSPE